MKIQNLFYKVSWPAQQPIKFHLKEQTLNKQHNILHIKKISNKLKTSRKSHQEHDSLIFSNRTCAVVKLTLILFLYSLIFVSVDHTRREKTSWALLTKNNVSFQEINKHVIYDSWSFSDCSFKKHHERRTYSVMLLLQRKGSPPLGRTTSNCLSLCLPLRANNFTEASEVPVLPVGILEVHGLLRLSHRCWTSIPIFVLTWSIS